MLMGQLVSYFRNYFPLLFVLYSIENGSDPGLFEGDIMLTPYQRFAVDMGLDVDGADSHGSSTYRQWTNGVVPYTLDSTICKFI